ncbi:MAG: hypothetical protein AAGI48_15735 [Verrucomicrobiota bacterium]
MRRNHQGPGRPAFTLLELVLAIGLLALLVGMIFAVATQNVALGNTVVKSQNETSADDALFDLLEKQFASLPGNARMELLVDDGGSELLSNISSDLTIQNVPLVFTWGGTERIARSVQLSTVRGRDALYDIVLRYYEGDILEQTQEVGEDEEFLETDEPFAEVVLMEDVYAFAWQVLDGRTMEWQFDWELAGRLPLQMELTYMRDANADAIRHVFWITPKQNPELLMRQLQQSRGRTNNNTTQPNQNQPGNQQDAPAGNVEVPASPAGGRPAGGGGGGGR